MKSPIIRFITIQLILLLFSTSFFSAQNDSVQNTKRKKNVVRYNLSGAMFFGLDKYIVLGYERVIWKNQTASINAGQATLPKLISIHTDLFNLEKDQKNTGYNVSLDYRFYPLKDNKHAAPRGVYIGPYFSYNKFFRENRWTFQNPKNTSYIQTNTEFTINTFGFELGYQLILWKCVSLDFVMVGPGWGTYSYEATINGDLDIDARSDLLSGLEQLITQRYPGANFIFSEKHINAEGVMKTTALGFRYLIHVGFNF